MPAWYNDNDPFVAQWVRNLIAAGYIPPGRADNRSIHDIRLRDVRGYKQVHFFCGIAGWARAFHLAGWPNDRPVWTGSCPCQPFSAAGKRKGTADERHLWPAWFRLIRECHPDVIFGEQVSSPDGLAWFDAVSADLEGAGYAVGALDTCAAGVGAPHLRQRLYFVAHADRERLDGQHPLLFGGEPRQDRVEIAGSGATGLMAYAEVSERWWAGKQDDARRGTAQVGGPSEVGLMANALPAGRTKGWTRAGDGQVAGGGGGVDSLADTNRRGRDGRAPMPGRGEKGGDVAQGPSRFDIMGDAGGSGSRRDSRAVSRTQEEGQDQRGKARDKLDKLAGPGSTNGFWADAEWLYCRDGKHRAVKPGVKPLAHGVSGRVAVVLPGIEGDSSTQETHWYSRTGALRGIGNALCLPQAVAFIQAVMDCTLFP